MQKIPFHGNEGNFWKDDDYDLLSKSAENGENSWPEAYQTWKRTLCNKNARVGLRLACKIITTYATTTA